MTTHTPCCDAQAFGDMHGEDCPNRPTCADSGRIPTLQEGPVTYRAYPVCKPEPTSIQDRAENWILHHGSRWVGSEQSRLVAEFAQAEVDAAVKAERDEVAAALNAAMDEMNDRFELERERK